MKYKCDPFWISLGITVFILLFPQLVPYLAIAFIVYLFFKTSKNL